MPPAGVPHTTQTLPSIRSGFLMLLEEDFVSDGLAYSQEAPFIFAEFQDYYEQRFSGVFELFDEACLSS